MPVVFVRMLEAWLLVDEGAIRRGAGFPSGAGALAMPRPSAVERLADPKATLRELILAAMPASARRGRRRAQPTSRSTYDIAAEVTDFEALRELSAYVAFERELDRALAQ